MNITEFAMFKKMLGNSGGGGGASAYTAKSIDELPSNAVDGSLALVGDDGFVGTWRLEPALNPPYTGEPDGYFEHYIDVIVRTYNGEAVLCKYIYFSFDKLGNLIDVGAADDDAGIDCPLYSNKQRDISLESLTFESIPENKDVETFIREFGTKTKTIYARENGEWVYKSDVF